MEHLRFKTNVQLKSIIGKDLINDDNIAILELVKNSFDANAKRVDIIFQNLKHNDDKTIDTFSENTSRILIKDNGLGMDLNDIRDKWLNIAYSEKKSNVHQHNRMMAGAKGVGRFSCDRLGEHLNLYARKKKTDKFTLLKIDWKKFEIQDGEKEIQSIVLDYEELSANELQKKDIEYFEEGVILEIIKLRSNWVNEIKNNNGNIIEWNTNKFVNLKKYLEKLINPNQAFEKNDFGIYLNAPEFIEENNNKSNIFDKFIGKIENKIFEKLDFKTTSIESEIIENGTINLTTLKDKGQTIFWIKEKNEFHSYLKNIKLNIYFLNPYSKAFFTRQTGIRSVDYGSIYLFINGFRISPYGEVDNDWLKLDQRKTQGYNRYLGTRELVGTIEIIDLENDFPIVTSREGLVENNSYNILTSKEGFIYKSLKRLEKYVVDGLEWDSSKYQTNEAIFREIENKIIKGEIDEGDTRISYREDDLTKRKRVYQTIHSIIGAKSGNVIELYINDALILEKIEEDKENAKREFEQLINDFENKKIDGETLNRILQKKALENKDLEKQIAEFSKYSINEATSRAIAEIQHYKDTIEEQTKIIEDLKLQLEKEKEEKGQYQQKIIQLQQTTKDAEEKAKIETEKRIEAENIAKKREEQIKRSRAAETIEYKDLRDSNHIIGVYSDDISKKILLLKRKIDKDITISNKELLEFLKGISFANEKISTLTRFTTKSNFLEALLETTEDIVNYIKIYLEDIYNTFYNDIDIQFLSNNINFVKTFEPIELCTALDNILSNSRKKKATKVIFEFFKNNNKINLSIKDVGKSLDSSISDYNLIFEEGITTTKGSGLGLSHVKRIVEGSLKGTIKYNPEYKQGFELIITF